MTGAGTKTRMHHKEHRRHERLLRTAREIIRKYFDEMLDGYATTKDASEHDRIDTIDSRETHGELQRMKRWLDDAEKSL